MPDTVADVVIEIETVPDHDTESDAVRVGGSDGDANEVKDSVYVAEPEFVTEDEAADDGELVSVSETDGDGDGEGEVESEKLTVARPEVEDELLGEPMRDVVGEPLADFEDVPHAV